MRIGIFVVMAGRQAGGPETYECSLIRGLAKIDKEQALSERRVDLDAGIRHSQHHYAREWGWPASR